MKVVVALNWHQYIVQQGDQLIIDRMEGNEGDVVTLDNVLLAFEDDGSTVKVGAPTVAGASVQAKIVEHTRGDKVRVFKFQGKKRYHKTRGFKAHQTVLSIESVSA